MANEYLIWSNEHKRWWGPSHAGYVIRVEHAGRYDHTAALDICANAIAGTSGALGMLPELPVRLEDAEFMLMYFSLMYPGHDPEPKP